MMVRKMLKSSHFTLIELLVSMGVFVVILGLMLQFFSGARRVWTGMEQRNDVYSSGRVGMDLMTNLLQSRVAAEENVPFVIVKGEASDSGTGRNSDAISFFTDSDGNLGGGDSIRGVRFSLDNAEHELLVQWLDNSDIDGAKTETAKFEPFFRAFDSGSPAYASGVYTDIEDAGKKLEVALKAQGSKVVMKRVTGFTIVNPDSSSTTYVVPKLIEIRLHVMDQKSFDQWKNMSAGTAKNQYLQQNERVFCRTVFFGDVSKNVD